jgi:hypothetical protein
VLQGTRRTTHLPSREIFATFRYRRVEIAEHVGVDAVFLLPISRWNQVDSTQRFILIAISKHRQGRGNHRLRPTISASWYSSKTSSVERRVPLRIVGSSERCMSPGLGMLCLGGHVRGMIVSLLRRSVKPILDISRPSIRIRPVVASTKRKKDNARVLLPEPVRPRMPTYGTSQTSDVAFVGYTNLLPRFYREIQIVQHIRKLGLMAKDERGT